MPRKPRPVARLRTPLHLQMLEDRANPVAFSQVFEYPLAGPFPELIAVGDINRDSNDPDAVDYPDVVVLTDSGISSVLNVYDGQERRRVFPRTAAGGTVVAVAEPTSLALADIVGTGSRLDLLIADGSNRRVVVAEGNGTGGFGTPVLTPIGTVALDAKAADLDRDGDLDVLVLSDKSVRVLTNNQSVDIFAPGFTVYPTDGDATTFALGDFNGDGFTDLAVGGVTWDSIEVRLNRGDGTFDLPQTVLNPDAPGAGDDGVWRLAAGDFNDDGRDDLAALYPLYPLGYPVNPAAGATQEVGVLLAGATGQLGPVTPYSLTTPRLEAASRATDLAVADLNGDGIADVVVTFPDPNAGVNGDNNDVAVRLGGGGGLLGPTLSMADLTAAPTPPPMGDPPWPVPIPAAPRLANVVRLADLDRDGRLDVIAPVVENPGLLSVVLNETRVVDRLELTAPPTVVAGQEFAATVAAFEGGTPAMPTPLGDYLGRVRFEVLEAAAGGTAPPDYRLTPADNGAVTLGDDPGEAGFVLRRVGTWTIRATDVITGVSDTFQGPPPRPAAVRSTVAGPATATAGVARTFTVTAFDAFDNRDTEYAGTVTFSSTDTGPQTALPANATFTSADQGQRTFSATLTTAGGQTVTVTDTAAPAVAGTSTAVAVAAAAPATTTLLSGSGQSAVVNTAYVAPLRVRVTDAFGNPVTGAAVTFAGPPNGPGVVFPNGAVGTTASDGTAGVTVRAKTQVGTFGVTAAAPGTNAVSYTLTAAPAAAASFTVVAAQTTITAGVPLAYTVTALDPFGNVATGYAGTVRFTSTDARPSTVLPADNTLVNGTRQFAATLTTSGTQAVTATDAANPAVTGTQGGITVNAAAGRDFGIVSGDSQAVPVGTPFAPIRLAVTDRFGNRVPGEQVTFTAGVSAEGATAVFPDGPDVTADGDGLITQVAEANTVAGAYAVTATSAVGSVTLDLANTPGPATELVAVSGGGQTGTVNAPFAQPLVARVTDVYGNGVEGVTVTFAGPAAGAGVVFPSGPTAASGPDGRVTVPVRANVVAGSYTVTGTVPEGFGQVAFGLTNVPAPAAVVVVTDGDGAAAEVGTLFAAADAVEVRVTDAFGNGVADVAVDFAAPAAGPTARFSTEAQPLVTSATLRRLTDAAGVARVRTTANTVSGSYTVTATAAGVGQPGRVGLTNRAAAPATATLVSGGGQSATVNTVFALPVVVEVLDRFGNPVPGVEVAYAGPSFGPSAAFPTGPTIPVTGSDGRAAAQAAANTAAGDFTATATVAGLAPVSFQLTNTPGAAVLAAVVGGGGQSAVVGNDFADPLQVVVTDAFGNGVPGVAVAFTVPPTGPSAAVTLVSPLTSSEGVVSAFAEANTAAGTYAVTARAAGIALPVSFLLTNTPGAVTGAAVVAGGGQTARVGTEFAEPVVVAAVDAFGNRVAGVAVGLTAPTAGATATIASLGGSANPVTGPDGTASFAAVANTVAGTYPVTASLFGAAGTTGTADLTNAAGAVSALTAVSGGGQTAAAGQLFGAPLTVLATDRFGNPIPNTPILFVVPATGPTAALPGGTTVPTGPDGRAVAPVQAGTAAGAATVTAAAGGAGQVTFALTTVAGPAARAVVVSGNNQTAETNAAFAAPLVVRVTDAFGNPVGGATVTFAGPLAGQPGAALAPATATTAADGTASAAATANERAGTYPVTAVVTAGAAAAPPRGGASAAAPEAVFTLTNATPPTALFGSSRIAAGSGAGQPAVVTVLNADGAEAFRSQPFAGFTGGVRTASADVNGDGVADVAVSTGPGAAVAVVLNGATGGELFRVQPFESGFTGGLFVALGDLDGDGKSELVVTPDVGGGPRVVVFRGGDFARVADFIGIDDPNFRGGARTALGDFNRDGRADLAVAAGQGGGPRVSVYDGASVGGPLRRLFGDLFVFEQRVRDGVYLAVGDVNGDGVADLIAGGGPGGGPRVLILDGADLMAGNVGFPDQVANFFAGSMDDRDGVRVAVKDLDGDTRADVVAGSRGQVYGFRGKDIGPAGAPAAAFAPDLFGPNGGVYVG